MPVHIQGVTAPRAELPVLFSEPDAAEMLGVTVTQLRRLTYERRGPKMVRVGAVRVFTREALTEWLRQSAR